MTQLMPVSETLPKLWLVFNLIGHYGRVAEDLAGFIEALVSPEVISACFQYLLRVCGQPLCTDFEANVTLHSEPNISPHLHRITMDCWIVLFACRRMKVCR